MFVAEATCFALKSVAVSIAAWSCGQCHVFMSFVPRTMLQLQELRKDRFCAQQLCYTHVGLVWYELSTAEDVAVAERRYQAERARVAAFRREAKLAKG